MTVRYGLFVYAMIAFTVTEASGQSYTISTFAGSTPQTNISGTSASLGGGVYRVTADRAGNLFFSDNGTILRLDAALGVLTLVAGNGTEGFSGDNSPASTAQMYLPHGVVADSAGNVYIADWLNGRVRRVSNGTITTVAGGGSSLGDNGPATAAQLSFPKGLALDSAGNLYIAEEDRTIRKVSNGVITTVAGSATAGFGGDNGPATGALLNSPAGVAVDPAGNVYIADWGNNRIRKVSNGVITTVAGNGTQGYSGDNGAATSASLNDPEDIAVDSAGNLYIADAGNNRIRKVSNGVITTVAGNGTAGFSGDSGLATSARLNFPNGITVDSAGNLYIADTANASIRKVANNVITTVAGDGIFGGDSGPATSAQLLGPGQIATDPSGNLYIADYRDYRIRKVSSGNITTVAGSGRYGSSAGDNGPATSAQINFVQGVAVDSAGNIYLDSNDCYVRKVANGVITTVAGGTCNGVAGSTGNGPAIGAPIQPNALAVDAAGNLFIADISRVREVSNGIITTIAGGSSTTLGDNGPATSAQLQNVAGIALDASGNLYIADAGSNRIRRVSNGLITTVAGNGTAGFSGDDGLAISAQLSAPRGVAVDGSGNLYIADTGNNRVREVSNGVITTVAGFGTAGFSGDNQPAVLAQLTPAAVALGSAGRIYVTDTNNNRIRILTPSVLACTYTLYPTSLQVPATGGIFNIAIQTATGCTWTVSALPAWISVSSARSGSGSTSVTLLVAPNTSTSVLNATVSIAGISLPVTQAGGPYTCTNTTAPRITGIDSAGAYGGYSYFASGTWLEIYGTNLADPNDPRLSAASNPGAWTLADFNGANAPTNLDGISVSIGGKPAYMWFLSPTQLNVQAPEDSAIGNVAITVTNCKATSPAFSLTRLPLAPGMLAPPNYSAGGKQYMVAVFASDGAYVLNTSTGASFGVNSRPAKPGDLLVAYGIGFGDVTPPIFPGVISQQVDSLVYPVTFSFGSTQATVAYAGLAYGFVGLYQFNIFVPPGLANGDYQITVAQNGTKVPQTMYLTVQN